MDLDGKMINVEELRRFANIIRDSESVNQNTENLYYYSQDYQYALQYVK